MRQIGIEFPAKGEAGFKELGPPPEPGPTQVLIETVYSGVTNGTERHAMMGEHYWGQWPSSHGYQQVGRIVKVGSQVKAYQPGQWVYYGVYVGHRGWNLVDVGQTDPKAYTSHLVMPLPDDVDKKHCALLGVAGVAMRGVRRFRVKPAQKVWVSGQGLIGHFAAQSARACGAHVTVTDINDKRLELAKECGAHVAINAKDSDAWDKLKAIGPFDVIIDGSGYPKLLDDILDHQLIAHGCVIGLLSVRVRTEFTWAMLHGTEASIEVSCHYSLDDLRVLLHFMREGTMKWGPLISHNVPVDQAPEIYGLLRDKPGDVMGLVFDWE